MNKHLADLILQHQEQLVPFLVILAEYSKNEIFGKPTTISSLIPSGDYANIKAMGLISIKEGQVWFTEGDRWLFEPRKLPKREKPSRETWCPHELTSLAEELGAPADFFSNTGKYVKLFNNIRSTSTVEDFEKAKKYFKEIKEDDWNIDLFLTKKAFLNFVRLSKVKKTSSNLDRQEDDYSDVPTEWS